MRHIYSLPSNKHVTLGWGQGRFSKINWVVRECGDGGTGVGVVRGGRGGGWVGWVGGWGGKEYLEHDNIANTLIYRVLHGRVEDGLTYIERRELTTEER